MEESGSTKKVIFKECEIGIGIGKDVIENMKRELSEQIRKEGKRCEEDLKVYIKCIEKKWKNKYEALEKRIEELSKWVKDKFERMKLEGIGSDKEMDKRESGTRSMISGFFQAIGDPAVFRELHRYVVKTD